MLALTAMPTAFSTPMIAPKVAPRTTAINMECVEYAKAMPGTGPFGFFDPLGFMSAEDMTEGRARYYREVEVKHGRVAMLAAVGFFVAEKFHPLFGGGIDVPSYVAFQATPLQTFWPSVVLTIGVFEFFSITTIEGFDVKESFPSETAPRAAGDFMFDPLGLKPKDAAALVKMQEKEINNGRLAMIAIAGMVGQELASGNPL